MAGGASTADGGREGCRPASRRERRNAHRDSVGVRDDRGSRRKRSSVTRAAHARYQRRCRPAALVSALARLRRPLTMAKLPKLAAVLTSPDTRLIDVLRLALVEAFFRLVPEDNQP